MEPLQCSAADASAYLPDARRTADGSERRGVRRVRPQRVLCGCGHGKGRAVQAQDRRTKMARHYSRPARSEDCGWPQDGLAATVPLLGCAAAALPPALILVSAKCRGLLRHGEPAGREAQ